MTMDHKKQLSKTMRIDLIPETPMEPVEDKKTRVVVASSGAREPVDGVGAHGPDASIYQQLLHSLYDAAIICDDQGAILDVNVRALDFFLYTHAGFCSLHIWDVVSGADEGLLKTIMENLSNERFTLIQAYCMRKDGRYFPSEIAVSKLLVAEGLRLCFYVRDITLRRQAEEMLRTEHNAIQNADNGIAVANINAEIEYANPSMLRMWNLPDLEAVMGKNVRELLVSSPDIDEMLAAVTVKGKSWAGEVSGLRRDGATFEVQVAAACNRNSEGETIGIVLSFADISDRKRAEKAEMEAERHRVMLESLGAACHHLGQPATVLLANLGMMQAKVDRSDPVVGELVEMSIEAAEVLGSILHKLNEVSEYKTTRYLAGADDGGDGSESRILDIG